jgi:hypothetical protein
MYAKDERHSQKTPNMLTLNAKSSQTLSMKIHLDDSDPPQNHPL